ncbi:MAG: hypothetical protein ISN26_06960 [Betaproteobacteria bacterium AqS2]|uniref:Aldose 1-epimerase n=1 Tax=Candidatus Amphirhobacter heronislandensis TaxID=1732024 RepID=A0A930UG63_9GAMM|nr:hypothetical protein [Betaproteobacteria bacterium AqS2]
MADATIVWDRGAAEIQLLGGMLGPLRLKLAAGRGQGADGGSDRPPWWDRDWPGAWKYHEGEDGLREVSVLAVAPWGEDIGPEYDALPPLMQRLRGEWPCAPFGAPAAPARLPWRWRPRRAAGWADPHIHGHAANHPWTLERREETAVELAIDCPAEHPLRRLERRIAGIPGEAAVEIGLRIEARREVALPVALHPVFALPRRPRAALLEPGEFKAGRVCPLQAGPESSLLVPDAEFSSIEAIPSTAGETSIARLPLDIATEELVQLCGTGGAVSLVDMEQGCRTTLRFDPQAFPSVLLWVANGGRTDYPWRGRFVAVGVEPVRAAFDLGVDVSCDPGNPIAKAGYPTALELGAGESFSTSYRIEATSL